MYLLADDSDSDALAGVVEAEDRRGNSRAKFRKNIRISPLDASGDHVATMTDLSRDGLYFTVRSQDYTIGSQLRITLPNGNECLCEVVRIEKLPSDAIGVGLRILNW